MKTEFYPSPNGKDVMLKILVANIEVHRIVMTRAELQAHKVAIEEYQEGQPMRSLKEGRGHE